MQSLKAIKSALAIILIAVVSIPAAQADKSKDWTKIDVDPGTYQTTDGNGVARSIAPSCSGGPVCTIDAATGIPTCRTGNKQYSFYFKPGKEKKKLVVYFDGGGACWDSNTCVTGQQTPLSTYAAEIRNGVSTEGLFDQRNPKNPYRDWNIAVLPYCTGDIHWGSNDQQYTDFTGAVTGIRGGSVILHHRGFDNFLFVRDWLVQRFTDKEEDDDDDDKKKKGSASKDNIKQLLVTGSSAGGYGAALAYPHMKQAFPKAQGYLMADAGNGVISDVLLQQAVRSPDARWGAAQNFIRNIPGMDGVFNLPANRFASAYYSAMAGFYPNDRFSQYTTLFDVVQALFYNISLNQNDIAAWPNITPEIYSDWTNQMVNHAFVTAANPNYRFYIAPGCNHTILPFNDDFYNTRTTQAPSFLSWFKALTREGEDGLAPANWVNSFCSGCQVPPTPQELGACLHRAPAGG